MTLSATLQMSKSAAKLSATGGPFSQTNMGAAALSKTAPLQQTQAMGPVSGGVLDYHKLLGVFTAPHAPELADKRCASAVERVARVNASGAAIRDLPYIEKLLILAFDYVNKSGTRALEKPLCNLMR